MACRSCKRCGASCSKRRIPLPKKRVDGHTQKYWMKRKGWIRKNFPNQDWDGDGVKNRLDCEPEDPRYQDIISKNIAGLQGRIRFNKGLELDPSQDPDYSEWMEEEFPVAEDRIFREKHPTIGWDGREDWKEKHPEDYEGIREDAIRDADDKVRDRIAGKVKGKIEEDKDEILRRIDSTVAGLSSEELNRELEEAGEDPNEFSEEEARRRLRQFWEDRVE